MKVAFAGTPDFAVPSLQLLAEKHDLRAIICPPDKAVGRGQKIQSCAVKNNALSASHIPLYQPAAITELYDTLKSLSLDLMIVVAYGQLLDSSILQLPRLGCINVHASLLPRWRGAAPIARAIEAGDEKTGITIMQMSEGLDDGDMLCQQAILIGQDNAEQLSNRLALLGAELLDKTLSNIDSLQSNAIMQDESLVCYAAKLQKEQGQIDWRMPSAVILQKIRAFNPVPISFATLWGQNIRIYDATSLALDDLPEKVAVGEVIRRKKRFYVRCLDGWVAPLIVQPSGKKKIFVADFLNGLRE